MCGKDRYGTRLLPVQTLSTFANKVDCQGGSFLASLSLCKDQQGQHKLSLIDKLASGGPLQRSDGSSIGWCVLAIVCMDRLAV
jgi:hypothetical protein